MWTPSPMELAIVLIVVLIIFGAGKLPEVGKALGKGIREFRSAREAPPDEETGKPSGEKGEDV